MEFFTPKELDIPFPEIARINIGMCPGKNTHYEEVTPFRAHTHLCKEDIYYKNICIYYRTHLFNSDGSISDILWHEYAHVLDTYNMECIKVTNCDARGLHSFEFPSEEEMRAWESSGHGPTWQKIMKRLGKKPDRFVNPPY